jgi:hypothetical protein
MSAQIKRACFDFLARDYKTTRPSVRILSQVSDYPKKESLVSGKEFIQRWYLSLQGEGEPVSSIETSSGQVVGEPRVCRYDWAFGITVIDGFYWDWMDELIDESALAMHLVLEPIGDAPEAMPVSATLSTLHPSRNTKSIWETAWPKIPKAAADVAKIGATAHPALEFVSSGLMLGSNLLESYTDNQKNWFLYQFVDEQRKCPVVEWRINKKVLVEYGPLLRGTLFLAFYPSLRSNAGTIRILLRPQIRYCAKDDICFLIPTKELGEDKQIFIESGIEGAEG